MRRRSELYPDYHAEIKEIQENGITDLLVNKIIQKHDSNRHKSEELYGRYKAVEESVPIFQRIPRFKGEQVEVINNRINNDFFSEIIDTKTGYYAGKPAIYKYGEDTDSVDGTGGEEETEKATKELQQFIKTNNMFDVDMEITKFASICGYAGRLFYVDEDKKERVMVTMPQETIILYKDEMTHPVFALRYYTCLDLDGFEIAKAEFYDNTNVYFYEGQTGCLSYKVEKLHLFDSCPLQGIPNNKELLGDAEKVLSLIDDYDSSFSDNSNDIESFANAYMVYKNAKVNEELMQQANRSGVIGIDPDDPAAPYDVYYLTKNIDGTFVNSHMDREEDNIYRFSKSPNLNDPEFNASSGIALKIKMTGLETKCGTFQAKHQSANMYMFELLAKAFARKGVAFDPMQCNVMYRRNFPVDFLGDAQAVQALIAAGLPEEIAFMALAFIDDIDHVLQLIEDKKDNIKPLDVGLNMDKGQEDEPEKTIPRETVDEKQAKEV